MNSEPKERGIGFYLSPYTWTVALCRVAVAMKIAKRDSVFVRNHWDWEWQKPEDFNGGE